jgi:hypothetical protein
MWHLGHVRAMQDETGPFKLKRLGLLAARERLISNDVTQQNVQQVTGNTPKTQDLSPSKRTSVGSAAWFIRCSDL